MLALKVPLKDAEKMKASLIKKGVLSKRFKVKKDGGFLYFPIEKRLKSAHDIVDIELEQIPIKRDFKERLLSILSADEMQKIKRSADIIGSIAIIELDSLFDDKKHEIAEEFLRQNKGIKTVLRKQGGHEGELRIQKYEWLAGEKTTIATHKENGAVIRLDVKTVYYSPRTATERLRIARLVKPGESILVMFSGCSPFPCVIAKNAKPKDIVGIELNPDGHKYGLENVRLNKLKNVHLIEGDVLEVVPKLRTTNDKRQTSFDRIIMPLPRTGADFLSTAFLATKKGTVIHFYSFQKEDEFYIAENIVKREGEKAGKKIKILRTVKAGQNAPRTFRICVDTVVV